MVLPSDLPPRRPEHCRWPTKRSYYTRDQARMGAQGIREQVEAHGGTYDTLHPYRCPDGDHWHLSHYPQGKKVCPDCGKKAPAWDGGHDWIIGAHDDPIAGPCTGEGKVELQQPIVHDHSPGEDMP